MPELPEVETVRRELAPTLIGRRFVSVDVRLAKMVKASPASLRRAVIGARVTSLGRRGKLLLIGVSSGWTLVFHLKMSGQLIWQPVRGRLRGGGHPIPGALDELPGRTTHVLIRMTGGTLYFNDLRQFGFVRLVRTDRLSAWITSQSIGPEIVDGSLSFLDFEQRLRQRPRRRLKPLLLDQSFVAGLGNIYVDESLFAARLHPRRIAGSLRSPQRRRLFAAIRRVLRLAVRKGGTTLRFFRRPSGHSGGMLPFLRVYGRQGKPCVRCGRPIRKIRLDQRGTHFCPGCQRLRDLRESRRRGTWRRIGR